MKPKEKYSIKSNRIHELRQMLGLTQHELAKATGVLQANICRWERGQIRPNIIDCWRLAEFFGVTIDYLIGRCDE